MSTHLILGGTGLVGTHVAAAATAAGHRVVCTGLTSDTADIRLDLRDPVAVRQVILESGAAVVYVSAAFTNVEACETDPQKSFAVNVRPLRGIVDSCNEIDALLVYVSTDYVFDGVDGPYAEDEPVSPICVYGHHKVAAEHLVATGSSRWIIARTTVVYGWETAGKNFVSRLTATLDAGGSVRVPDDQLGSPTFATGLGQAMVHLADSDFRGVVNLCGRDVMSRYDFAVAAARAFGLDPAGIELVSTDTLGQVAPRPLNAGMFVDKADSLGCAVYLPGSQEGLVALVSERPGWREAAIAHPSQ